MLIEHNYYFCKGVDTAIIKVCEEAIIVNNCTSAELVATLTGCTDVE
ncbi:MAG: hypothetical protein IGS39_05545 [Calothrix sp. C42_A2020_038]|nr:hypothetical protein [Calothrix sp. C42_A2020_038]